MSKKSDISSRNADKLEEKTPISVKNAREESEKVEFMKRTLKSPVTIEPDEKKPKKTENEKKPAKTPVSGESERVVESDSPVVKSFWRQKEKADKEEVKRAEESQKGSKFPQ